MIVGSTWMVGMRWAIRGLGIVSTIILVRLLAPADFGLIAISSLTISFLSVLTSFGVDMALIQRTNSGVAHYNTAWTIRILQTTVVAVGVFLLSSFAARYFHDPRIASLMQLMSLGILVGGFENIGVVDFRKNLEFHKEFAFMVLTKFASFFITIGLAIWLRNYWALAWGTISLRLVSVILSYRMHPFRPRLSLSKFDELWSFSQWMLARNIGMYLRKEIDTFLVARTFGTDDVGLYSVPKEISELPTTEVIWPMARALFPGYAMMSNDKTRLGMAYAKVLSTISLISLPAGIGLALVAEPLVTVMLGERWIPISPILAWLSMYGIILTISASVQAPLIALGQMRRVTLLVWMQLLLTLPVLVIIARQNQLELIAQAQFGTSLILMPIFFAALTSLGVVRWLDVAHAIWRPLVASSIMAMCVTLIPSQWFHISAFELLVKTAVGATIFIVADLGLWIKSKRPDGGEYAVVEFLAARASIFNLIAGKKGNDS